jgi:hypothetical protein
MPAWLFQGERASEERERDRQRGREMAAVAWKRALPQARRDCFLARRYLSDALGNLRSPMLLQSRDGEGRYILLDSAKRNVERACMCLSSSVANMAAAELMTLRLCAPVPAQRP